MPPALGGRKDCFGTSGKAFSLLLSFTTLADGAPSSVRLCDLCALLAFSCTLLNFSKSSAHFIAPSSRAFNRLGLSKPVVGVCGVLSNEFQSSAIDKRRKMRRTSGVQYEGSRLQRHCSAGFSAQQKQRTEGEALEVHKDTCKGEGIFQVQEVEGVDLRLSNQNEWSDIKGLTSKDW